MKISELSIRRPVLATVLTIIILLFGFIGYNYLGVREYPSVDNPIISVSCSYPGANADVIENQITEPLEQNIKGIPGCLLYTSSLWQYCYTYVITASSANESHGKTSGRNKPCTASSRSTGIYSSARFALSWSPCSLLQPEPHKEKSYWL